MRFKILSNDRGEYLINLEHITYLEGSGHDTKIYFNTATPTMVVPMPLRDVIKKLELM